MKKLGMALLGCGHHYHAPAWVRWMKESPAVRFLGLWDPDPRRGKRFAEEQQVPSYRSAEAVLSLDGLDAVAICSENDLHADLIVAAARAGKHVYCEKPMATTLADCRRIEAAVGQAGILYGQSFPKRYDPLHRRLASMVAQGAVGRVAMVRLRHGHAAALGGMPDYANSWFTDPARNGGGSFLDEGVHAADLLAWLLGPPTHVSAMMLRLSPRSAIDQAGAAVFGFADGAVGEVCSGSIFAAATNTTEVFGDQGAIVVQGTDGASRGLTPGVPLWHYRRDWPTRRWRPVRVKTAFGQPGYHALGLASFVRDVRAGRPPAIGIAEARTALELILAAYESARTGRRVALPLKSDNRYRVKDLVLPAFRR